MKVEPSSHFDEERAQCLGVVVQSRSGMLVTSFLEDEELAKKVEMLKVWKN